MPMGRCLDITPPLVAHSPLMEATGCHLGHLQGERQRWPLQWLVDSGIHGWRQSTRLVLGSFTPDCPLPYWTISLDPLLHG